MSWRYQADFLYSTPSRSFVKAVYVGFSYKTQGLGIGPGVNSRVGRKDGGRDFTYILCPPFPQAIRHHLHEVDEACPLLFAVNHKSDSDCGEELIEQVIVLQTF